MKTSDQIKNGKMLAEVYDPEVKTPAHDAIMLWLHENIAKVLQPVVSPDWGVKVWSPERVREIIETARVELQDKTADPGQLPEYGSFEVEDCTWELPLTKGEGQYKRIMGFVDLQATYSAPATKLKIDINWTNKTLHWDWPRYRDAYFEVKSSLPSLGEAIRQINLYRELADYGKWFLVCPEDTHRDLFEDQSIHFIQCPKPKDLP